MRCTSHRVAPPHAVVRGPAGVHLERAVRGPVGGVGRKRCIRAPRRGHVRADVHDPAVLDPDDVEREPHALHPERGRVVGQQEEHARLLVEALAGPRARAAGMPRRLRRLQGPSPRRPAPPFGGGPLADRRRRPQGRSLPPPGSGSVSCGYSTTDPGILGRCDRPPLPHPAGPRRRVTRPRRQRRHGAPGSRGRHRGDRGDASHPSAPRRGDRRAGGAGGTGQRRAGTAAGRSAGRDRRRGVGADARPARRR